MSRARHRRAHGTFRVSRLQVGIAAGTVLAVGALGASWFSSAAGSVHATRPSASLAASSSAPAPSPAEGHSPRLLQELSGPLAGTGKSRPGSTVHMSTTMQQATAAAASTTLNGVDVSSFQHPSNAAINWASVAGAGYQFVAIKATEGNYYVNPYYASDAAAAAAAGMYVAAYHFANPPDSTGAAQADYAVQNAGNYKVGGQYLPLALDLEYDPYSTDWCYGLSPAQMVSWISGFVTEATTLTGAAPIIYTPRNWWELCTGSSTAFGSEVLWVPAYSAGTPGALPDSWNTWTMWQYTSSGTVAGISGSVDLDYFSGGPQSEQTPVNAPASVQIQTLNALAGQQVTYTATGLPPGLTISADGMCMPQLHNHHRIVSLDSSVAPIATRFGASVAAGSRYSARSRRSHRVAPPIPSTIQDSACSRSASRFFRKG